jgi:nucleotide-binding universal stress UspA family protein
MAARRPTRQRDVMPLSGTGTRSTIVCGVDRSPHARAAARLAILLARRLCRPLELVHVVEPRSRPSSVGGMTALRAVLEEELDVGGIGVRLQSGSVVSVLAEAAHRSSLLVLGNRGEGAMRRALFGSVSGALTSDPPCPIVVVPPTAAAAREDLVGRVIVCAIRDERDALAAHPAAKLAGAIGQTLALAHVIPRTAATSAGGGPPGAALMLPTPTEREAAFRMLGQIARPVASNLSCDIELHVLDGAPGPQLDRLAAAEHASMVAVGASERGPLAAALAGAPARHLMRHGKRPVLIYPRARHTRGPRERSARSAPRLFAWQGRG